MFVVKYHCCAEFSIFGLLILQQLSALFSKDALEKGSNPLALLCLCTLFCQRERGCACVTLLVRILLVSYAKENVLRFRLAEEIQQRWRQVLHAIDSKMRRSRGILPEHVLS